MARRSCTYLWEINGSPALMEGNAPRCGNLPFAAGNTPGIDEVESHFDIEDEPGQTTFYTVNSGDTLSKIAKQHYGDAMKYPMIFEANKPMLSDPDKIYPGQILRIPQQD